jgi:hypothetical protein
LTELQRRTNQRSTQVAMSGYGSSLSPHKVRKTLKTAQ